MNRASQTLCACMLLASVFLFVGAARTAQKEKERERVKVRELMTEQELRETGVWKLASWEEKALDEWLTRYRERVAAEARGEPLSVDEPAELKGKSKAEICDKAGLPKGWVQVDDRWSPTSCGNPTSIVHNVWQIERYTDKPIGAEMDVCAATPTPEGWEEVGKNWNPTRCGSPTNIVNNVKRIKRVN